MPILALLACAPPVPTATVDGARITRLGWTEAEAEVCFLVDNPLPIDLRTGGWRWSLTVDGSPVASGERPTQLLPAGARTSVAVPVAVAWADALAAGGGDEGSTLGLDAELSLDAPWGPVRVPLSWEVEAPSLAPPSIELLDTAVGVRGGDLVLGVELQVDLPLGAEPRSLGWAATMDGTRLGSGEAVVGDRGHLALPLAVDPVRATRAALWVLTGHPATLALSWSGSVDTALGEVPLALDHELRLP